MKKIRNFLLHSVVGVSTLLITTSANANYSWTFDSNPVQGTCEAAAQGNSCTQSSTFDGKTIDLTTTAWATSVDSDTSSGLQAATIKRWDGLGIEADANDGGSPQHAIDNSGKLEAMLYDFGGDAVTLSTITVGWHTDADFSLLRYTGSDSSVANLTGETFDNLTSNGWELVGNYTCGTNPSCSDTFAGTDRTAYVDGSDGHYTGPKNSDGSTKQLGSGDLSSSYWLIAALNGAFWDKSNYLGNDFFKVKTLTGTFSPTSPDSGSVPEPSGILLILTGLIGWHLSNTKRNKTTSSSVTA